VQIGADAGNAIRCPLKLRLFGSQYVSDHEIGALGLGDVAALIGGIGRNRRDRAALALQLGAAQLLDLITGQAIDTIGEAGQLILKRSNPRLVGTAQSEGAWPLLGPLASELGDDRQGFADCCGNLVV
jgi:hypothetical protein